MYKQRTFTGIDGIQKTFVFLTREDGGVTLFPNEQDNPHYQAYLKWLEEGNTPEPADEAQ
jgi:hypothetical protein